MLITYLCEIVINVTRLYLLSALKLQIIYFKMTHCKFDKICLNSIIPIISHKFYIP